MNWVNLVRVHSPHEAKFIQDRLLSEGMPCVLQGLHSNQIMPLHGIAMDVSVQVQKKDLKEAKKKLSKLLKETKSEKSESHAKPVDFRKYAINAAIIGNLFVPGVASLLSWYFFLRSSRQQSKEKRNKMFYVANLFNLLGIIVGLLILRTFLSSV